MATREPRRSWRAQGSKTFTQSPPNTRISHTFSRPGRRRFLVPSTSTSLLLSVLVLLSIMCTPTLASSAGPHRIELEARINDIVFDPRPVPEPQIYRRQFDLTSTSTKKESKTTSKAQSTTSSPSATATDSSDSNTSNGIDSAPLPSGSVLPKAFDGGLGTNYTQPSCPDFLKNMINNDTFSSCLPFSLLLQVCLPTNKEVPAHYKQLTNPQ